MYALNPGAALFLLWLLSSHAISSPIAATDPSGKVLLGIDRIEIAGELYDARFVDDSFENVFTRTTGYDAYGRPKTQFLFDFGRGDAGASNSASTALLRALNLFPQWDLRLDGYSILGTGSREYWRLVTPYDYLGASIEAPGSVYASSVAESATSDFVATGSVYPFIPGFSTINTDFQYSSSDVWVDWSRSAAATSISSPSAFLLIVLGLCLLHGQKARLRKHLPTEADPA